MNDENKKIFKIIAAKIGVGLFALVSFFMMNKASAHAELDLNQLYYDLYGTDAGTNTGKMEYGVTNNNQGWLCYIINDSGHIVYAPQFFYKTGGYIAWNDCDNTKNIELSSDGLKSRIDGQSPTTSHRGYEWGDSMIGTSQSGSQAVIDYMYAGGEGNFSLYAVVGKYWGSAARNEFSDMSKNYYFVMEPVYWHGTHEKVSGGLPAMEDKAVYQQRILSEEEYYKYKHLFSAEEDNSKYFTFEGNCYIKLRNFTWYRILRQEYNAGNFTTSGTTYELTGTYCGTVYNGALYETAHNNCFIGVYSYRHNAYAHYVKLKNDWPKLKLNKGAKTGNVNNADIISNGYGIGLFWNKGPSGGNIPGVSEYDLDGYIPTSLYETRNYSNKFNISEAIPTTEEVINEYNAASWTAGSDYIKQKQATKNYTKKVTYNVIVETKHHTDAYDKVIATTTNATELPYYQSKGYDITWNSVTGVYTITDYVPEKNWTTTEEQFLTTKTYTLKASVNYQYINSTPSIYQMDSATIKNVAYPSDIVYNKDNSIKYNNISAALTLYNTSSAGCEVIATNNGGTTVGANFTPGSSHYSFYSGTLANESITLNEHMLSTQSKSSMMKYIANYENGVINGAANTIANGTWSRNDRLTVNDNKANYIILDDTKVTGCTVTWEGITVSGSDAAKNKGYNGIAESINNNLKAKRNYGRTTIVIPEETANADWPTGIKMEYFNVFNKSVKKYAYAGLNWYTGADSIYDHVMSNGKGSSHNGGDPADGYPIRVHTPIASPIQIVFNDGSNAYERTQLINGVSFNDTVKNQLLLDRWYFIKWDNERWMSATYGDVEGYDGIYNEYVQDKYLQFPFSVVYNNTLYNIDDTGYTDWIKVVKPSNIYLAYDSGVNVSNYESANHWIMTPFYIPSFAEEGGLPGNDIIVNVKVEAINVDGRDYVADRETKLEIIKNTDQGNYVALSSANVQLSGWVYDFTVVGTDNEPVYTGKNLGNLHSGDDLGLPLCKYRWELKGGTKNRLGTEWIRFADDGYIDTIEEWQTIALQNGYSLAFSEMGDVWRGQRFAFTLKTIANLSNPNDSIEITPSYTYIKANGEVLTKDEFCFVEMSSDFQKHHVYDPTDTSLDNRWAYDFTLNDTLFQESFYDGDADKTTYHFGDWINRSVANENKYAVNFYDTVDAQEYVRRPITSFTINHISLPAEARYISGEYEQLQMNISNMYNNVKPYSFNGYDSTAVSRFMDSMQQWNGEFQIPNRMRIVDTRNKGGAAFNFDQWLMSIGPFSWQDYDLFEPLNGRMIINFDIIVYKDGQPYLQYSGGGKPYDLNMWDEEQYVIDADGLPHRQGDVVITDIDRSIADYWTPGIWNIN